MASLEILDDAQHGWSDHEDLIIDLVGERGKKLKDVVEHVNQLCSLSHPSESTLKKRITKWDLRVKNHRSSVMVAAAAHYQYCKDNGEFFIFRAKGHKTITEEGLMEYARRSGHNLRNGRLEKAAVFENTASATGQGGASASRSDIVRSTVYERTTSRLIHCNARYSQRHVYPLDLVNLKPFETPGTFLKAIDVCLLVYCNSGGWHPDKMGSILSSDEHVLHGNNFGSLIFQACERFVQSDFQLAHVFLQKSLLVLQRNFKSNFPSTMFYLLRLITWMRTAKCPQFAMHILSETSRVVQSMNYLFAELKILFSSLTELAADTLLQIVASAFRTWSDCLRCYTGQNSSLVAHGILAGIFHDKDLTPNERAERISALLTHPMTGSDCPLDFRCTIMSGLADAHILRGDFEQGAQTACTILNMMSKEGLTTNCIPLTYFQLARALWGLGLAKLAISMLKISIDGSRHSNFTLWGRMRLMISWQESLQADQAAQEWRKDLEQLSQRIACFDLEGDDTSTHEILPPDNNFQDRPAKQKGVWRQALPPEEIDNIMFPVLNATNTSC